MASRTYRGEYADAKKTNLRKLALGRKSSAWISNISRSKLGFALALGTASILLTWYVILPEFRGTLSMSRYRSSENSKDPKQNQDPGILPEQQPPHISSLFAPVYGYRLIKKYPHDITSFTQGLVFDDRDPNATTDMIYESCGGYSGSSRLKYWNLNTGELEQSVPLPDSNYFAEGLELRDDKLYQVTWLTETGVMYDAASMKVERKFSYTGQGWGLAFVPGVDMFYMSNGSDQLTVIEPETMIPTENRIRVIDGRHWSIGFLNDLQVIEGELWANVWGSYLIARIHPRTGRVLSWVSLRGLLSTEDMAAYPNHHVDVLNGIAYDKIKKRIFVTGKLWPAVFHIEVDYDNMIVDRVSELHPFFLNPAQADRVKTNMGIR